MLHRSGADGSTIANTYACARGSIDLAQPYAPSMPKEHFFKKEHAAPRTKAGLASVGKPCDHAIKDIDVMTCGEPASETSPKKMDRGARGASSVITCASSATNWDMILTCTGIYNYMASKRQKLASVRSHHFVL